MELDVITKIINRNAFLKRLFYPAIVTRRFLLRQKRSIQSEILQNLCELLVEDPVIRIDEFQGSFAIDCRSHLFQRVVMTKNYEPLLVSCCIDHMDKNRDAIDVGANVGFYTVLFAKNLINGKVLSIEPTPNALLRLHKNIHMNGVVNKTIVFEGVASNCVGHAKINTVEGNEEYSSLGEMYPIILKEKLVVQEVASTTIDHLVNQCQLAPGFIKIDAEGSEHLVLQGSRAVLQNNRPIVLLELSNYLLQKNSSSSFAVINILKDYNYNVIDPIDPRLPPGNKPFGDILCLPR